jgi:uncharacterized protein YbjT (DUF2867 family)
VKVVIFGATGMVGQGALRESLLAPDVEQVLAVVRTPTGVRHPKLREASLADFADLTPLTFVYVSGAGTDPQSRAM